MLSLTINKTRALVRFLIQMSSLFVKRSLEREENECPPRLYCKNRLTKIFTRSRGFSFLTFLCALASGSGGSRGYIYSQRSPCAPPSLFYTRALSLSLPLYISPFTFLTLSLLSIILFGVSNGRFRPCLFDNHLILKKKLLTQSLNNIEH